MDRSHYSIRISALLAALAAAALLLAAFAAPRAGAEDVFRFDNETGEGFTSSARDVVPECWSGVSGVLAPIAEPTQNGSIRADVGPFDGCGEWWGADLAYGQTLQETWEEHGETERYWTGGVGVFGFTAEDPVVGGSSLSCAGGNESPILNVMSAEVDGDTCTVEWLPGAGPSDGARASAVAPPSAKYTRFVSSLAPVAGGKARIAVQAFARHDLRVEDGIVLRTLGGHQIGRATTHLRVGAKAKRVPVTLAPAARRALAKRGELVVKASIRHVDGSQGGGDSTSQLVLRRSTASQ
jgi:hypothetical protein